MTIKMKISTEKEPIVLKQPAFLVGNGINLADDSNLSWSNLLSSILPEKIKNEIEQSGKHKTLEESLQGLTYPEIAELAELQYKELARNNKTKIPTVKRRIRNALEDRRNKTHKQFIEFCKENHIPVLTSNFDHRLLSGLKLKTKKKDGIETPFWFLTKEEELNNHLIPYRYPFRAYFAENKIKPENIRNEFAVWHVHGTKRYIDSICINSVDYARNIAEIDKMIRDKDLVGTEIEYGKGSWIDIFMKNDLVIMGFALDEAESDMRWLLRERYVYLQFINKDKPVPTKTIYIYNQNRAEIEMPFGKEALFNTLGIRCVPMEQDEIYILDKYLSTK